jgi:outer membrane lipoprotein carrier protein
MNRPIIIILLLVHALYVYPQKDPAAIKVLDKFSSVASAAPSVSMKFDLVTTDQSAGTTKNASGSIILSRDKYRLELQDNIIWFNGETSWSYLPEENEVTISKPDKKDNSFEAKPSSVFSMYKKGYKVRLIEDQSGYCLIDLYPEDIKSENIRIRLRIGKPAYDLKSVEYKYKNGIDVLLSVKEYDLLNKPDATVFTFPYDQYKGVEINDMR